jgi:phosphate transport system substrate-binding protein
VQLPRKRRLVGLVALCGALALGAAGCGGDGSGSGDGLSGDLAGAGASSQAAAMEAWVAGFQTANSGATVTYEPIGSGGGREQFAAGGIDFGATDAPLAGDELTAAQDRCGGPDDLIEIPVYVSPIAIVYNLPGVAGLRLSPETLARIFTREITRWDDAAIAADNPGADLPDTRIVTVNRSDESGTTENVAGYLAAVAPDVWTFEVDGTWPVRGGEAGQGTAGVIDAVKAGEGTIGYADASQAGDLGTARIGVGDAFVGPTPEAAAAILDESRESADPGRYVFTFDLDRTSRASGVYPIVLASYVIACTRYDSAGTAALMKGWMRYLVSPEGQRSAASHAGSAPLSDKLTALVRPAVDAIGS